MSQRATVEKPDVLFGIGSRNFYVSHARGILSSFFSLLLELNAMKFVLFSDLRSRFSLLFVFNISFSRNILRDDRFLWQKVKIWQINFFYVDPSLVYG